MAEQRRITVRHVVFLDMPMWEVRCERHPPDNGLTGDLYTDWAEAIEYANWHQAEYHSPISIVADGPFTGTTRRFWSPQRVVRTYSVGFMAAMAATAVIAFTPQPPPLDPPTQEQTALYENVPVAIPGPPPTARAVEEGEALAYIRIPRFGSDWVWTVVEGVSDDDLAMGPGHYPGSALPGNDGNAAIAGHRSGHGEPFADFPELRVGDRVVLAQNGAEWTYEVVRAPRMIETTETWVTDQTHESGRAFNTPHLTLTTCWPRYGSAKRLFVRAALVDWSDA